jgi:hypothetical protein
VTITDTTITYTRDEIVEKLEAGAQARLGVTAVKMIDDYRQGRLERYSEVSDLVMLADLLPASDPLSPRRDAAGHGAGGGLTMCEYPREVTG